MANYEKLKELNDLTIYAVEVAQNELNHSMNQIRLGSKFFIARCKDC